MKIILKTICMFLISVLVLSGCATVPITGRKQLVLISNIELKSLSGDSYRKIIAESKLSDNAKEIQMVNSIGSNIVSSAEKFLNENGMSEDIGNLSWEFSLIEDKTANAFAMPGGKVAVYSGILKYTKNEDGLAVVIAHEVAHVIANHGGERMSQMMLAQFGHAMIARALEEKKETTQQFLMLAYGVSMNLGLVLPYSRLHEKEADRIGLILMAQAGYNPYEAISFWERMSNDSKGSKKLEFLSTHPVPENRISEIREYLPVALKYYGK